MKKIFVFAVSIVLLAGMVSAYGGGWAKEGKEAYGMKIREKLGLAEDATAEEIQVARIAKRDAVHTAVTSGDYVTWAELIADTPHGANMLEKVTADNFAEFSVAMTKIHEAKESLEALGIEQGRNGQKHFNMKNRLNGQRGGCGR